MKIINVVRLLVTLFCVSSFASGSQTRLISGFSINANCEGPDCLQAVGEAERAVKYFADANEDLGPVDIELNELSEFRYGRDIFCFNNRVKLVIPLGTGAGNIYHYLDAANRTFPHLKCKTP